jgi:hypothetical protein
MNPRAPYCKLRPSLPPQNKLSLLFCCMRGSQEKSQGMSEGRHLPGGGAGTTAILLDIGRSEGSSPAGWLSWGGVPGGEVRPGGPGAGGARRQGPRPAVVPGRSVARAAAQSGPFSAMLAPGPAKGPLGPRFRFAERVVGSPGSHPRWRPRGFLVPGAQAA